MKKKDRLSAALSSTVLPMSRFRGVTFGIDVKKRILSVGEGEDLLQGTVGRRRDCSRRTALSESIDDDCLTSGVRLDFVFVQY